MVAVPDLLACIFHDPGQLRLNHSVFWAFSLPGSHTLLSSRNPQTLTLPCTDSRTWVPACQGAHAWLLCGSPHHGRSTLLLPSHWVRGGVPAMHRPLVRHSWGLALSQPSETPPLTSVYSFPSVQLASRVLRAYPMRGGPPGSRSPGRIPGLPLRRLPTEGMNPSLENPAVGGAFYTRWNSLSLGAHNSSM